MSKKGRYDGQRDETRYAAISDEQCEEMAERQGWELKRVEPTGSSDLPADCVFDGDCEFPDSGLDKSQPTGST